MKQLYVAYNNGAWLNFRNEFYHSDRFPNILKSLECLIGKYNQRPLRYLVVGIVNTYKILDVT